MSSPELPRIMGILNVTDDSFSDGGKFAALDAALEHADEMLEQGAQIIDVGGESTRPGAQRVTQAQEISRVVPVIQELASQGIEVSIDTMRAATAQAAVSAGARYINDVSGGQADSAMWATAADVEARYILMHWDSAEYSNAAGVHQAEDITGVVAQRLNYLTNQAQAAGIKEENIIVDPGLGFAKNASQNWELLNNLSEIMALGYPVLVGASRKRFLQSMVRDMNPGVYPESSTLTNDPQFLRAVDVLTAGTSVISAAEGAWSVRVHDVETTSDALQGYSEGYTQP